jgi:hypothetical protein
MARVPANSPAGDFRRLLDRIEAEEKACAPLVAVAVAEVFWPVFAETPPQAVHSLYEVVAAYAADEPLVQTPRNMLARQTLEQDFAHTIKELRSDLSVEDLRRFRRRCALFAHPDRRAMFGKDASENFMAELNAAIDRAIRKKSERGPRR